MRVALRTARFLLLLLPMVVSGTAQGQTVVVRQKVAGQGPDINCILSTCAYTGPGDTVTLNFSPTLPTSALMLIDYQQVASSQTCIDNLGQVWVPGQVWAVAFPWTVYTPPAGGVVGGITSITCSELLHSSVYLRAMQFFEVTNALLHADRVSRFASDTNYCQATANPSAATVMEVIYSTYKNSLGGNFRVPVFGPGTTAGYLQTLTRKYPSNDLYFYTNLVSGYVDNGSSAAVSVGVSANPFNQPLGCLVIAFDRSLSIHVEATTASDWSSSEEVKTEDPKFKNGAHFALGSTFKIRLFTDDGRGNKTIVPSRYSSDRGTVVPNTGTPTLFADSVVIKYAATTNLEATFQAVHKGSTTLTIVPEDPSLAAVVLPVAIGDPAELGSSHPEVDPIIYPIAHNTGIPPQYIKAQMAQESAGSFNPFAYRYEPLATDYDAVSRGQDLRTVTPHALYRFATVADSRDAALPTGSQLSTGDIAPREVFQVCANKTCNSLMNITDGAQYVSAKGIMRQNDWRWHWGGCPSCLAGLNLLDGDDFTAQTAIASSYGYMQALFPNAVVSMRWNGVNGRKNPALLFDTPANLASGGGSVNLAASYLRRLCGQADESNFTPGGGSVSWTDEAGLRLAFKRAWVDYNGKKVYGDFVSQRVQSYLPQPATAIFMVQQ